MMLYKTEPVNWSIWKAGYFLRNKIFGNWKMSFNFSLIWFYCLLGCDNTKFGKSRSVYENILISLDNFFKFLSETWENLFLSRIQFSRYFLRNFSLVMIVLFLFISFDSNLKSPNSIISALSACVTRPRFLLPSGGKGKILTINF